MEQFEIKKLMVFSPIIYHIITLALGIFIGYLTTYIKQKATNKAHKQDTAEITRKSESVKNQFAKKKYQYEKKHQVYSLYHNLLDKFDSKNPFTDSKITESLMSSLVNDLYKNQDDKSNRVKVINHFGDEINRLVQESLKGLKEIANQTNEIKLVGSDAIVNVLHRLNDCYKKSGEISDTLFKDPYKLVTGNTDFSAVNDQLTELTTEIEKLKTECIKLMREDLERI